MASALDSLLIGAAVLAALYLAVRPHFESRLASAFISAACGVMVFIAVRAIDGERYSRHEKRMRTEAEAEIRSIKLLLSPEAALKALPMNGNACFSGSAEGLDADELIGFLNSHERPLTIIAVSKPTENAERLINTLDGIEVVPIEKCGADLRAVYPVSETEIDEYIIKKHGELLKKPRISGALFALTKERAIKYLAVGAALMLLSFFVRYAVYYRLIASLTLGIGSYVFAADAYKRSVRRA